MNIRQYITAISIVVTLTLFPAISQAITVEEVANPQQINSGWVTDMAEILSSETEAKLNHLIDNLERVDGTEITVVTVPETSPADSPKAFATELFNRWGIGKAELDNGVLFLISQGDNRVEIETGYGIPERLSNEQVAAIIDRQILPQYRLGNFDSGTLDGTQALVKILNPYLFHDTSSNLNLFVLWLAIASTGTIALVGGIAWYIRTRSPKKMLVRPNQNLSLLKGDNRTVCCEQCHQPMKRLRDIQLTEAQEVAQKLNAVEYRGYQCSNCKAESPTYSILAYRSDSDCYDTCSKCQELTMTKTSEVATPPQRDHSGELIVKRHCHCCGLEQKEIIKLLTLKKSQRRRNSHSQNHHHDYAGYSDGYCSGGGSSGGDFGGGASGGDGTGGSW